MIQHINEKIRNDEWTEIITSFIFYLESTTDEQWCIDIVRSSDMSKNCLVGHFCEFKSDWDTSKSFSWFEENVSPTYYFYNINDGKNDNYKQSTPKKRCIEYLKNVLNKKELTTYEQMDYDYEMFYKS